MNTNIIPEKLISSIIDAVTEGITKGLEINENKKNKEFEELMDKRNKEFEELMKKKEQDFESTMKRLDYYRSQNEDEIKEIFDYWIELIRITQIKDNENLGINAKNKAQAAYNKLIKVEKISEMNTLTLKYGEEKTIQTLRTIHYFMHSQESEDYLAMYGYMKLFCNLKKDILNIETYPLDVLAVYVNDIWETENLTKYKAAKEEFDAQMIALNNLVQER